MDNDKRLELANKVRWRVWEYQYPMASRGWVISQLLDIKARELKEVEDGKGEM